ncbi:MAG TPA: hypothetical protein VEC06_04610 [Paucimonas sp.]|nr:hypothetical protein [Paucimonas sp.]
MLCLQVKPIIALMCPIVEQFQAIKYFKASPIEAELAIGPIFCGFAAEAVFPLLIALSFNVAAEAAKDLFCDKQETNNAPLSPSAWSLFGIILAGAFEQEGMQCKACRNAPFLLEPSERSRQSAAHVVAAPCRSTATTRRCA